MPTLADRECHVFSVTDPLGCIISFLDRSRYYFFQVAPQLYSRGWADPVPDPLLRKYGSAGNRTRTAGSAARNSWPLDHRCGRMGYTPYIIQPWRRRQYVPPKRAQYRHTSTPSNTRMKLHTESLKSGLRALVRPLQISNSLWSPNSGSPDSISGQIIRDWSGQSRTRASSYQCFHLASLSVTAPHSPSCRSTPVLRRCQVRTSIETKLP
jgi:hypothetical protein